MKKRGFVCLLAVFLNTGGISAQIFTSDVWEQNNLLSLKMSQLFYEINVGINVNSGKRSADFLYLAFGYGNPTKKNAWRKFIPENNIPAGLPDDLQTKLNQSNTDDLHAGKVGVGWNHWFNHAVGCYAQVGWGFIADLSTGEDLTEEEKALLADAEEKSTFIYNTIPVELGMSLNLWKHYHVQAGVTYMWKEIPLLTIGVGYAF